MCEACSDEGDADEGAVCARGPRRKLWEIDGPLLCSVVGTCLTLGDLRRIERRLNIDALEDATEFQVHGNFVLWAGKSGPAARQMYKMLERRYAAAIRRYAAATDPAGLLALWTQSLEDGDIPGPYWALLTHPAADKVTVMRAFGQVHMLSHLLGAASRADIRRLTVLQAERDGAAEALTAARRRIAEQDRDIRHMLDQHAREVRELSERISAAAALAPCLHAARDRIAQLEQGAAYRALQSDIDACRAALALARDDAQEQRSLNVALLQENDRLRESVACTERSLRAVAAECEAMELILREHLQATPADEAEPSAAPRPAIDLAGRRIVYVGGRGCVIPHLRALVERTGGVFLHHDGGLEEQGWRLDGLLGQGDAVFCPIDCVSHDACLRAKRSCRQRATAFVPLRTCSLSSFVDGLRQLSQGDAGS